ncbi:MAG: hypothetical protein AAF682_16950 [Planctomycetota bacterium]
MASPVLRGRNPCLRCHEPLPAFRGASIRCSSCGHINVYRVRLRTWSERPGILLAERILKASAIVITPAGVFWCAFRTPDGPSHVAYFAPLAGAWLLWISASRLRSRGGFGRTDVVLRNSAGALAVLLTVAGAMTATWAFALCAVPFALLAALAPRVALSIARARRARVERALAD